MTRPTLDNWLDADQNHWSFRHVRELIPSARVRHGVPRELPSAPVDGLLELANLDRTDSIVVLADGKLALEWYADGVRPDDTHILMSVTKSVTALLAGALSGAGKLDLTAPVVQYVPECAGSCYEDATVRHLLDMTVGAAFVEDYTPGPDVRAYRQTTGWYQREPSSPGLHEYLCTIKKSGEHGERFYYISINTDMLGWVCERAGGAPYADLLSQYLWGPIGAEADADVTVDRFGAARAAGGLNVIPRDLARIGQLIVEDGAGAVPAEFVDDLREGGEHDPKGDLATYDGWVYRGSWYQPRWDPGVTGCIGIYGQSLYVDSARKVVVATQSSWPYAVNEESELGAARIAQAISHRIAGD